MLHKLELILRHSIADVNGCSTCSSHASALRTPPLVQKRALLEQVRVEAHLTLAFPNLWEQISDQCLKPCPIATSSSVYRDIHRSDPTATQYHHSHHRPKDSLSGAMKNHTIFRRRPRKGRTSGLFSTYRF